MKKLVLLMFLIFFSITIHSQHTKRFLDLTKVLKVADSTIINKKYKNGNLKESAKIFEYDFGEYTYTFYSGKRQFFLKKGELFIEQLLDNYGNILMYKQFNKKGRIRREEITSKIDSKAASIENLLNSDKNLIIETYEKEYADSVDGELILYMEGARVNGKKIGVWITYNGCGEITKKKNHSK